MTRIVVIHRNKVKQWFIVVLASFFAAAILFIELDDRFVFSTKQGPKALYKCDTNENIISLTFNISFGDERAVPIIDALKREGVKKATFFLSGSWAESHPDVVEKIVKEGYEIASLGYEYKNYSTMKKNEIKQDMLKAHNVLSQFTKEDIRLIRPPNGQFNKTVLEVAQSLNYSVIHFSVNTKDWLPISKEEMIRNATEKTTKGDILLFSASDSAKHTAEILPEIIQHLRKNNLNFVTTSDLISNSKINTNEIQ